MANKTLAEMTAEELEALLTSKGDLPPRADERVRTMGRKAREAEIRAGNAEAALKAAEDRAVKAENERDTHAATLTATREEMALGRVGLTDPEAVLLARRAHAALPERDRPELAAWWDATKADPKAKENLSPGLRAYLPADPSTETRTKKAWTNTDAGTGKTEGITPEKIAACKDANEIAALYARGA